MNPRIKGIFFKYDLEIDGNFVKVSHESSIDKVAWGEINIDIVIDSSGIVDNIKKARSLSGQIKRCIITHSPDLNLVDKTIIFCPFTIMESSSDSTVPSKRPCIESYLSK